MELKDLEGEYELSGLDTFIERPDPSEYYQVETQGFRFILDGITYEAAEDDSDGYRSYLKNLRTTEEKVDYTFPPQKVIGRMKPNDDEGFGWTTINDILELVDPETGKTVLEIGTRNTDDYYPSCVMSWHPENLKINQ